MKKLLISLFALVFTCLSIHAQEEPIGWKTRCVTNAPAFDPANAPSFTAFSTQSVITNAASGVAAMALAAQAPASTFTLGLPTTLPVSDMARIKELARGLDYDWQKCYRFVRDNIAYAPYFGIMRGPERTLLDREGNDADQAFLLLALLRASGYESATVAYEPMVIENGAFASGFYMPLYDYAGYYPYNAAGWLDVPVSGTVSSLYARVSAKLDVARRPVEYLTVGSVPCVATDHFWVVLTIDGVSYYLDPSFKPTSRIAGHDIASDMGYLRSALIASAGGTVDVNSAKNLSESGLSAKLNALSASLRSSWTNANASVSQYLGRTSINAQTDGSFFHGFNIMESPYDFLQSDDATKNQFRASATLTHGTLNKQFYLDELGARHLWISYAAANTAYPKAVLKLNDTVLASETTGAATAAASMTLAIAYNPASMTADYPLKRSLSNVYAIPVGFGGDARGGMRTWATEELTRLRASGVANTDVRMLERSLQVAGQQWLAQTALATKIRNKVSGGDYRYFYNIGVAGQADAPYVDMKNSYGYSTANPAIFDGGMLFSSALEHAVLDQLNGTNASSISTVKILELANASGNPVYFANNANYATVQGLLSGYSATQKTSFQAAVTAGRTLLLPKSASTTLNQWTGFGYIEHGPASEGTFTTGMIISGGMNGGFGTVNNVVDNVAYTVNTQPTTTYGNGGVPQTTQADPVSMPSGAYLDSRVDLTVNGKTPLAWTRHYDSRGRCDDGDLGRGWSHGYEASIVECADPDAVFGRGSVEAAIPTAVAMSVVNDMLAEQTGLTAGETARRWTIAALTVQWWTKQLTGATVAVNLGAQSLMFQKKTDGTFAPYPGVTATLTLANGVYTLAERLGSTYTFNADKLLASIKDRSGNTTALTYNSSKKLTRIANAFGAYFNISWNGDRISQVIDNASRFVKYTYDANGCLTKATDALSKNWTATYDAATFALLTQTNPENQVTIRNAYNEFGQVTNQVSAIGQPWTFGYESSTSAWDEDPLGNRLTQSYTDEGRVTRRIDRDGAATFYTYDGNGHIVSKRDAFGRTDYFVYDGNDNLILSDEGVDDLYRITDFVYDPANRLVATTNALGQVTSFTYDTADRLLTKTLPDGSSIVNTWGTKGLLSSEKLLAPDGTVLRQTAYTYGTCGLPLTKTVTGSGLPATGVKETYTYSTAGQLLTVKDANNHITTFTYDARGKLLTAKDPASKITTRTYTNAGRLNTVKDALNRMTTSRWTPSGELAAMAYPDGTTSTNVYDAVDNLASATDARGATVSFTRDAMGRVLTRTTAAGTEAYTYNAMGLQISATDGANVTTLTGYDWLYRPFITQNALGNQWQTGYDLLDRPVAAQDPRGKIRHTGYDALGRKVTSSKPSGATDHYGYDGLGNWCAYTNAEGKVYTMAHDALGRMTSATDAAGHQVVTNVYDGVGNLVSRTDGNGAAISYAYDVCDRLTGKTGTGVADAFTYDAVGNLLTANNATASETFAYDVMNRLATASTTAAGHAFPVAYRRDNGGLVTNIVYAAGKTLAKTYDTDGRLVSVSDWLGHVWTFAYDGAGKPAGGTSPDGAAHGFTYDAAGQLSGWSVGAIAGRTIERDASGRRIRDTVTAGPMPVSAHDRRSQNVFDDADRITSASIIYGVTNAPVAEAYLYDGNGAMTNIVTDGASTFDAAYTAQGQLASLGSRTFAYDAIGNRITSDGHVWIPDHSDPMKRPLMECASDGTVLRYYLWGNGRLLGFIDAGGTLTVAHSDEQGSVVALTSVTGAVLFTANYGPHGEDWGHTGTSPTPFAWLGGHGVQKLASSSTVAPLYLTRHRLYSATLNRFLSADPLGLSGGLNLYAYGDGSPLAYIDPLGLCASESAPGFFENFVAGFTAGDFADRDIGWGGTAGQIVAGIIPVYGQVADARDTAANIRNVWNEPSSGAAWAGLGGALVAWVPGVGDAAKGAYKGGSRIVNEVGQSVVKNANDATKAVTRGVKYSDDAAALIDLSKQAKRTGLSPNDAKTLIDWAHEYNVTPALDHTLPPLHWNNRPHIRVGPINHIEVQP